MSSTTYRIVLVLIGIACFALAYIFRLDAMVHDALIATGGLIIGAAGFRRPGDVGADEVSKAAGTLALCLCVTLGLTTACHSLSTLWPTTVKCAGPVSDLVAQVSQILLSSPDPQSELEALARTKGAEEVICVVDTLVHDWSSPAAAPNPERAAAVLKGRTFLAKTGTKVER